MSDEVEKWKERARFYEEALREARMILMSIEFHASKPNQGTEAAFHDTAKKAREKADEALTANP